MGMYTQIRGWLNVNSIGSKEQFDIIKSNLKQAQNDFEGSDIEVDRKWVCQDTIAHQGANGSAYLFIGTELKNYNNPAYEWIKYLLDYFPNAEGRIDFQYEEEGFGDDFIDPDKSRYLLIREGKIIKDDYNTTWCKGYGNDFVNYQYTKLVAVYTGDKKDIIMSTHEWCCKTDKFIMINNNTFEWCSETDTFIMVNNPTRRHSVNEILEDSDWKLFEITDDIAQVNELDKYVWSKYR